MSSLTPEARTQHWLEAIVVGLGLCPFAKRELVSGRVRIAVLEEGEAIADVDEDELRLQALARECQILDNDEDVATTLLVFANALQDFDDYLDFVALSEGLLLSLGYEGVYQLASFHPNYCFEGSEEQDAANYTNRSPYPMLHLLREAHLSAALASYDSPELIFERNKEVCRELGIPALSALGKLPR